MQIAQELAGYSLGAADLLRRAMGKKKKSVLDAEFVNFEAGMKDNGSPAEAINALWETMVPFSAYGFNKSHAAAYGLVSYWTAYLKANYPAEYMAALLGVGARRQGQVGDLPGRMPAHGHQGAAARRQLVPGPVHPGRHRRPLRAGRDPQRGRQRGGRHPRGARRAPAGGRLRRLPRPRPAVVCNKRVIESLIKAGAFDSMGHTRRALMEVGVDIRVEDPSNGPIIYPIIISLFEMLLMNILTNAIKYNASPKPRVDISFAQEDHSLLIRFRDNGIGIAEGRTQTDLPEVLSGRRDDRIPVSGSGIGLYLVQQIARLHHGKIVADSEGEDKGSRLHADPPLEKAGRNEHETDGKETDTHRRG